MRRLPSTVDYTDRLDKGVDAVLKKLGRGQSIETTEKISDGVRVMFKKVGFKVHSYPRADDLDNGKGYSHS